MKIAVLSDTHNLLRPQVLEALQGADAILHGGDISSQSVLDQLSALAPVYAVRGNNDKQWAEALPHDRKVTLAGVTFCLVHKKKELPQDLSGVDVVIFGHSHQYSQQEKDGILFLNPGSCGPRRFHQEITMAMIQAREGQFTVSRIRIPHGDAKAPAFDSQNQEPVIRCSICTGEQTAGFRDLRTGHFTEVMLIRNDADLEQFKQEYGIDTVKTIY